MMAHEARSFLTGIPLLSANPVLGQESGGGNQQGLGMCVGAPVIVHQRVDFTLELAGGFGIALTTEQPVDIDAEAHTHAAQQLAAGHAAATFDLADVVGRSHQFIGEIALADAQFQACRPQALADGLLACIHVHVDALFWLDGDPSLRRVLLQHCGCLCFLRADAWERRRPAIEATN